MLKYATYGLLVLVLSSVAVSASPSAVTKPAVVSDEASRALVLDALLARLATSADAEEAQELATRVWRHWSASGSDSVDLLMRYGLEALEVRELEEALRIFNHITSLAPGYAEGWHKRSTVNFILDDYQGALGDLEHVLRLEPRHFGALSGLAIILRELGDEQGALAAYRKALAVRPFLPGAQEAVAELTVAVEGHGI